MSLKAKRKVVSSIPPMDGGTYMGVCVAVVDLGQQYKQFEKQKQGKYAEECMFIFEIPDERVEVDGARTSRAGFPLGGLRCHCTSAAPFIRC